MGMRFILPITFAFFCTATIACTSDVPIGTSRQALDGIETEGFCTPAHCRDSAVVCPSDSDKQKIVGLRCVPNPQVGSGVGTCRLEGECVAPTE